MYIKEIAIKNFRPYYGSNTVDLTPRPDANIILIGGKTGHGKTSFLTAIVWAIYGNLIDRIDNKFLGSGRRTGYYSMFCKESINKTALTEGEQEFSVSVSIEGVELPDTVSGDMNKVGNCTITRSYNIQTAEETLLINLSNQTKWFSSEEEKMNFINDYIIPLEAAKFIFFDAEQLVNIAALSAQEEGVFMNDALNKILGLDIYQSLLDDLIEHADNLRKESANIKEQETIEINNNAIQVAKNNIETKIEKINALVDDQKELNEKIYIYEKELFSANYNPFSTINQQQLEEQRKKIDKGRQSAQAHLNKMGELIPLCIGAEKIRAAIQHLEKQKKNPLTTNTLEKCLELIGGLFYQPPFSANDISNTQKIFYLKKAQDLFSEAFPQSVEHTADMLTFEHDITKNEQTFINDIYQQLLNQSSESFRAAFDDLENNVEQLKQIDNQIKKQEADSVDETIIEWAAKKAEATRALEDKIGQVGSYKKEIDIEEKRIADSERANSLLLSKVQLAQESKGKLENLTNYTRVIEKFISDQKQMKCISLQNSIQSEFDKLLGRQALMSERLIHSVSVTVMPNKGGLSIKLFDEKGNIFPKTNFSEGQKQIYVSCLIKAILAEAVQEYPIFIDTPLGRLDQEHINNILQHYYPNLARQVVILPQDNEIPPSRYAMIREKVALTYLLSVKNRNTTIQPGYFQSL